MVLMKSYFFCASVRLGVIIISAFALLKSIAIIYVISTHGMRFMLSIISSFDINLSYRASYYLVRDSIYWMEKYPQAVSVVLQLYSIFHVMSCAIAAYGAFKLKKRFVIPLAIFEFIYIVEIVAIFTLFLRILRHFLSLTHLTLLTIAATFYAMLVAYDFLALVAFEQIVRLVKSKRYQQFYGLDPLNPITSNHNKFTNTEQRKPEHSLSVFVMPKMSDKWWQVKNSEQNTIGETCQVDEMYIYFQSQELLPDVILHNGINSRYINLHGF